MVGFIGVLLKAGKREKGKNIIFISILIFILP